MYEQCQCNDAILFSLPTVRFGYLSACTFNGIFVVRFNSVSECHQQEIKELQASHARTVSDLQERLLAAESSGNSHQRAVTDLQERLLAAESAADLHKGKMTDLQERLLTAQSARDSHKHTVTDLQERLSSAETAADAHECTVSELQERLSTTESTIADLQERLLATESADDESQELSQELLKYKTLYEELFAKVEPFQVGRHQILVVCTV